ncbi:thioredoxin family protein [Iningainema tapete]|uniref:Redoxin domain-containing protein n=1 Tax=Iningainema tapete BLCC-T55 TaxID=2748662 RepID=A0A8J6XME6_9CYAN|nr:redoxin domain-containing protein [Iningainema tapete]MBD2775571.1 redoxin domain-containing protein [Iningainema tapete BLCC-T55]
MMKKQLLGIAVVGAIAVGASVGSSLNLESISNAQTVSNTKIAAAPLRVGQPAPDFTGVDSNGKSHRLSDFKGKVVVLEWTNHQCPFVKKHYDSGNMQKLQKSANGKGVVWLSINSSAPGQQGNVNGAQANELTKSRGAAPTAVLLDSDGKIGRLYNARTTPHMYVIASNGTLAYMGAIDSISSSDQADVPKAKNYVSAALDTVSKGQKVDPSVTQPYGCTVKYGS